MKIRDKLSLKIRDKRGSGGGVVRNYGTMYAMRPLRNFKTNQCCHLISRIANRAFFLWLSVDDEKQWKARRRNFARFEQSLPDRVPHLLEKGSDKVAYDILKQLADGPRRPAELRAALGIASANFFTARYLTPLAKSGYIAVAGGEKNRYLPGKQYRILRKGKAVVRA